MRSIGNVTLGVIVVGVLFLGIVSGASVQIQDGGPEMTADDRNETTTTGQNASPEVTVENRNETTNRITVYTVDDVSSTDLLVEKNGAYQQIDWDELYMASDDDLKIPEYEDVTKQQYSLEPGSETTIDLDGWETGDSIVYFIKRGGKTYWSTTHCADPDQSIQVTIKAESGYRLSGEGCTP